MYVKLVEMLELKLVPNLHWFLFKEDINFMETFEELKW